MAILGSTAPLKSHAQELTHDLPQIQDIEFTGNSSFDAKKLREQMLLEFPGWLHPLRARPRYLRNVFPKELRRVEAFYRREGFGGVVVRLDSVVTTRPGSVRLHIGVHEGPRTLLRDVRYTPQQVFSLQELQRATPIAAGDPYPFSVAHRGRLTRALRVAFLSRGHIAAAVQDSTILAGDSTEAVLVFKLDPGPQFRIRALTIAGNLETDAALIRGEMELAPGQVYSYAKLKESQEALYNTQLFRRVTIREENIDIEEQTVGIAVRVIERKLAFVEGSVGIGRRDQYEARVAGRWGHRNLNGRGHSIELAASLAYNLELGGDNFFLENRLQYRNPHFFDTSTRLVPQLAYTIDNRLDAELERVRADVPFFLRALGYTVSFGPFASLTSTTLEEATDDARSTLAIQATISRNSSANFFDPRGGDVRSFSTTRAGFGFDNNFTRLTGAYARYLSMGPAVLALSVRTGWVEAYGDSRNDPNIGVQGVPFEFLFQAGGNTTVRGFDNNSLGPQVTVTRLGIGDDGEPIAVVDTVEVNAGTVLLLGNAELRFPLPWVGRLNLGAAVFLDAGNVWTEIQEMLDSRFGVRYDEPYTGHTDMRYSYGIGLRYRTPFGPIRIDWGFPFKKFTQSRVHMGLGHPF
jgi:outer membrane protein insertion porin family